MCNMCNMYRKEKLPEFVAYICHIAKSILWYVQFTNDVALWKIRVDHVVQYQTFALGLKLRKIFETKII